MLCETRLDKDAPDWSTWIGMITFLSYDDNNNGDDGECDDDAHDNDDDDNNGNYIMIIILYKSWVNYILMEWFYVY